MNLVPTAKLPSMADQVRAIAANAAARMRSAVVVSRHPAAIRCAGRSRMILTLLEQGRAMDSYQLHAALAADPTADEFGAISRKRIQNLASEMKSRGWLDAIVPPRIKGLPPAAGRAVLYRITETGHAALQAMRDLA